MNLQECKICTNCLEVKPYSDFYKSGKYYKSRCKVCINKIHAERQKKSPRRQEYLKEYYLKNADHIREKSSKWRQENLDKARQAGKDYRLMKRAEDLEAAKLRARGYSLKRKYGITLEQYDELLEKQAYCCALCGRHESEFKTKLAVDHAHAGQFAGRVRGLLCTSCNYRLVARHHDGNLLRKIADYVEQATDWHVPEKKKKKGRPRASNSNT